MKDYSCELILQVAGYSRIHWQFISGFQVAGFNGLGGRLFPDFPLSKTGRDLVLCLGSGPMSARQLLDTLNKWGRRMSKSTIYNVLNRLKKLEFVRKEATMWSLKVELNHILSVGANKIGIAGKGLREIEKHKAERIKFKNEILEHARHNSEKAEFVNSETGEIYEVSM